MRLGNREKEILLEIAQAPTDMVLSFVLSRGSIARMYSLMNKHEGERAGRIKKYQQYKQQRKRLLQRLEQKGLIKLVSHKDDQKIIVTQKGNSYVGINTLFHSTSQGNKAWDGNWTLVMFDIPQEEKTRRKTLVHILRRIGFRQTQMSNYVFPYEVPEVENFLKQNPTLGRYCQVFRGKYKGDDTKLRELFNLS